jgi:serine/threonine protein kinase
MPNPKDPSLIIDPRLGSLMVSASGHLDATFSESQGAPLEFGLPAAPGEAGTLGPYRVVRELGRGGMGAVFLAVDTRLDRQLALKVMLPEFAANAEARERFLREARAAAKIGHDNVVTVFEADERDGIPYITMQLLQGYPLDAFIQKKGTPSLRNVLRITREAALGLAAAHKLGVVHRDVKPANLWLEAPHGRVKLLDFGLARPDGLDSELTKTGVLIGTPAFMSPEQALGERVDQRTDLFSLGAVLYWLCTGQLPFPGLNVVAVLKALATEEPKPVLALNPKLPGPLAELIHQLLARAPERRPQTATEVANRLHEIMEQSAGLSSAMPAGGTEPAGGPSGADPWSTLARSAASQQAGEAPLILGEPKVLHSMPVVAITPMNRPGESQKEQPQKPATGPMRTVISSGILWEEVEGAEKAKRPDRPTQQAKTEEETEEKQKETEAKRPARWWEEAETGAEEKQKETEAKSPAQWREAEEGAEEKRPDQPTRRVKAEEEAEEEQRETEAKRSDRSTRRTAKRRAKEKNASARPLFIGIGAVGLIVVSVVATLLVVGGRPKATESAQPSAGDLPVIPGLREESPKPPPPRPRVIPPPKLGGLPDAVPAVPTGPIVVARGKDPTVIGGGNSPVFKDLPPEGGLLIGLELGIGRGINDDMIPAGRSTASGTKKCSARSVGCPRRVSRCSRPRRGTPSGRSRASMGVST